LDKGGLMPFESEKQRRWMWANEPKMARKWNDEEKRKKRRKAR
jgi:hypothetical protein